MVGDEISLSKLTVPQLKEMLREKRLPVTGIKKVLLERVVAALALDKSASGGATGDQSAAKKQRRENVARLPLVRWSSNAARMAWLPLVRWSLV